MNFINYIYKNKLHNKTNTLEVQFISQIRWLNIIKIRNYGNQGKGLPKLN